MRTTLLLLTVLSVSACDAAAPQGPEYTGTVTRVVDGDSLYIDGVETQIRLFGVDAPERDERGFNASKTYLTSLALRNTVTCRQVDIDRYDRIVARCFLDKTREINRLMIDEPNTLEYCRYSRGLYGTC